MTEGTPISGVDYAILDPFKIRGQELASETSPHLLRLGQEEVTASRGESAFIWRVGDNYHALTLEGLGTKNLVADAMGGFSMEPYYNKVAYDTVATIINDLVTVGAKPQAIMAGVMAGSGEWFKTKSGMDFLDGWKQACDYAQVTWGGGESQALADLLMPKKAAFFGAAAGFVGPKENLILGQNLKAGDVILGVASSGIHANGLTDTRRLAKRLPDGFATKLPSGKMFGEQILQPTFIYARLMEELAKVDMRPNYVANITGHGFQKLMRSPKELTYKIDRLPEPQEEFRFIQEHAGYDDRRMYSTFNMGVGYALFVDREKVRDIQGIIRRQIGFPTFELGKVQEGPRQVVIEPLDITFNELGVR